MRIHQLLSLAGLVTSGLSGVLAAQEQTPTTKPPALSHEEMLGLMKESLPFELHGGVLFWHWDPSVGGQDTHSEIYYANLLLDAKFGDFGYHFEPRFRDTKLRQFYESNVWIQENYLSWHPLENADSVLKAGKIYTQFGRMWDGVFYGNIPYFDGVKLDPDLGVSWESRVKAGDRTNIDYSVQYFTEDGATNGSLQGRDTLSIGTERNIAVGRVAPTFKLGDKTSATVGVSAMHFDADLATESSSVSRENAEAAFTTGPFTVFADYTHQAGNHVLDFPVAGSNSDDINYLMSGVSFVWKDFTFRYSYSSGDYKDEDVKEDLHLPGIEYRVNKNLAIWLEYVYWNRDTAGVDAIQDRSVNLILYGSF
jgi:hypothetical protein